MASVRTVFWRQAATLLLILLLFVGLPLYASTDSFMTWLCRAAREEEWKCAPTILFACAEHYQWSGRNRRAIETFEQFLEAWPVHPRAPEAFLNYLELYSEGVSGQFTKDEALRYHKLFYEIYPKVTKKHGKPHPKFYVYWTKVRDHYILKYRGAVPPTDPKPPDYEGPLEQQEGKK